MSMVAVFSTLALAAPGLGVSGQCPGPTVLTITGATPSSKLAVLSADDQGSAPLPGGPCAIDSGLSSSGLKLRKIVTTDASGGATLTPDLPGAVCGNWVQVVDVARCEVSPARQLPGGPDCSFTDDPANAVGEPPALAGMTALHNAWRARVGLAPLWWNRDLARSAQAHADRCVEAHDPNRSPDAGYSYVGENLYFRRPTQPSPANAIASWVEGERGNYDFGQTIQSADINDYSHYTQVVWDDTESVGCGIADCITEINWWVVVCRYGPGGNYIGQTAYDYVEDQCVDLDNDDVFQWQDADDTDRTIQ